MHAEAKQLAEYVARHPEGELFTPRIRSLAVEAVLLPLNVARKTPAGHVVFARGEGPVPYVWKVNDRWLTEAVFGRRS